MRTYPEWAEERIQAITLVRDRLPMVALYLALSVLEGMSRARYSETDIPSAKKAFCEYFGTQWKSYWINTNGPGSYPMPGINYYGKDAHLIKEAKRGKWPYIVPGEGDKGYPGAGGPPFYVAPPGDVLYHVFRKPLVHEGRASALKVMTDDMADRQDGVYLGNARFCNTLDGEFWLFGVELIDFLLELPLHESPNGG